MAVVCAKVEVKFGKSVVLDGASMVVETGSIYALLGPSGSGKTTLMSCFLGLIKPSGGKVLIFGREPGSPSQLMNVPGRDVGFMPQDLCLHKYLTVRESFIFYLKLYGLGNTRKSSGLELLSLLGLEDALDQSIAELSEGQKRRVSISCALLHSPKLLLLDEPTVGIDPVLRETMWHHLGNLCSETGTTVVITTHDVHEAERAKKVGFVRKGVVLEEGCPEHLKRKHLASDLEDLFCKLCYRQDGEGQQQRLAVVVDEKRPLDGPSFEGDEISQRCSSMPALTYKNLLAIRRHTLFLIFFVSLPLVTLLIFTTCVGTMPRGLTLGVLNEDFPCWDEGRLELNDEITCPSFVDAFSVRTENVLANQLSCLIIDGIAGTDPIRRLEIRKDELNAVEGVRLGKDYGYIHFKSGYSKSVWEALLRRLSSSNGATAVNDRITVRLDETNLQIAETLRMALAKGIDETFVKIANVCGSVDESMLPRNKQLVSVEAAAGENVTHSESMLPGLTTIVLHFMAVAVTADFLVSERESGLMRRGLACGIDVWEYLTSQLVSQLVVVVPQLLLSLAYVWYVLNDHLHLFSVLALGFVFLLQCVCGMAFGLMVSVMCTRRDQVVQVATAAIMPAFLLSGVVWPREGMSKFLKVLSECLPLTLSCDSAKEIALKNTLQSWIGFAVPTVWTCLFLFACFIVAKCKSFR